MWLRAALLAVLIPPAFAVVTVHFDPPVEEGPNLLANGGFEDVAAGQPAGWRWGTATPDNFEVTVSGTAHDGQRAMRVVNRTGSMSGYFTQSASVQPERDYLLTVWLRAEAGTWLTFVRAERDDGVQLDPPFDQRVYGRVARGNELFPVFLDPAWLPGSKPDLWTPLLLRLRTTPSMTRLVVNVGSYFAPGDGIYDDASLRLVKGDLTCRVEADQDLRSVEVFDAFLMPYGPEQPRIGAPLIATKPPPGTRTWSAKVVPPGGAIRVRVRVVTADGRETWARYPEEVE
ncbi:MAG: hypothetical protein HYU66_07690 [Armatimonadetes bacterium]|nr:hypothetical protein [Armatimonadota bacterium]